MKVKNTIMPAPPSNLLTWKTSTQIEPMPTPRAPPAINPKIKPRNPSKITFVAGLVRRYVCGHPLLKHGAFWFKRGHDGAGKAA